MKIKQLYFYPIKSLRGIPVSSATLTSQGIPHDRRFMLFKVKPSKEEKEKNDDLAERLERMTVTYFPQVGLFSQDIYQSEDEQSTLRITYNPPPQSGDAVEASNITVDLDPQTEGLREIDVSLHRSPTKAFIMEDMICNWFSECFGWEVILVYMPEGARRAVLGNLAPSKAAALDDDAAKPTGSSTSWFSTFTNYLPSFGHAVEKEEGLSFADCAPYLVVTEKSVKEVSTRLPDGVEMDVTKFRPNIVLEGAGEAYEEDFWGAISILPSGRSNAQDKDNIKDDKDKQLSPIDIILTHNCLRCQSLDINYTTGRFAKTQDEMILKKLMRDRRVDEGKKYSPVFGRYGFLEGDGARVQVGDEVVVKKTNEKRTKFHWPGLS